MKLLRSPCLSASHIEALRLLLLWPRMVLPWGQAPVFRHRMIPNALHFGLLPAPEGTLNNKSWETIGTLLDSNHFTRGELSDSVSQVASKSPSNCFTRDPQRLLSRVVSSWILSRSLIAPPCAISTLFSMPNTVPHPDEMAIVVASFLPPPITNILDRQRRSRTIGSSTPAGRGSGPKLGRSYFSLPPPTSQLHHFLHHHHHHPTASAHVACS